MRKKTIDVGERIEEAGERIDQNTVEHTAMQRHGYYSTDALVANEHDDDDAQPPPPFPVPESKFPRYYLVGPSITGVVMTVNERRQQPSNAYSVYRMESVEALIFVVWVKEIVERGDAQRLLDHQLLAGRIDLSRKWKIVNGLAEKGFPWPEYLFETWEEASQVLYAWRNGKDSAQALEALGVAERATQALEGARLRREARKLMDSVIREVIDG